MIELGKKARDTISGFEGIVTARHEYLYGCKRVSVTPQKLQEGKPIACEWFDEGQLEIVEETAPDDSKPAEPREDLKGGPQGSQPQRTL